MMLIVDFLRRSGDERRASYYRWFTQAVRRSSSHTLTPN